MRLVTIIVMLSVLPIWGADTVFQSPPERTHLLELFTSQGCSSCPPAEAWLSKLKAEPRLWQDFVPLAFHVDYWDRLGWRDAFAAREWTARQYQYSASWKKESVYTPGFVLDGQEWAGRSVPGRSNERPGVLKLTMANGKVIAEFTPAGVPAKDLKLHLATLGFGLRTNVTAGENAGRNLSHDFVVLSLADENMPNGKADFSFKKDERAGGIAAWITSGTQPSPIQAVGGWLR